MVSIAANNVETDGSRMTARAITQEMMDLYPHSFNVPTSNETAQLLRQCGFYSKDKNEWDKRSRTTVKVYARRPK
jgi:hypothetical protein